MKFDLSSIFSPFRHPDLLETDLSVSHATRLFFWVATLGLGLFLVWCSFSRLDIVSLASGKVMPSSKVKSVQHLEGGIIREIMVREGDRVEEGQPLVYLEKTWQDASAEELQSKSISLRLDIARLQAELDGKDEIRFEPDLEQQQPLLAARVRELMKARLDGYRSELSAQKEKIVQRQKTIEEIKAGISNNQATLKLIEKQISISEGLLKDKLTTEYNHLTLMREASQKKGEIEKNRASLQGAQSALKEAETVLMEIRSRFQESARQELKEKSQMLEELSSRQVKTDDSLARTVVRAPVAGIIKTLNIVTEGGIVQPGMKILDIVPEGDQLIVQAKLPVSDIGYVRNGQRAILNLAGNDARRFGSIDGTVSHISPDTFVNEQGSVYYNVHILPEKSFFAKGDARYDLYPGVLVNVFIHTGQRTIMEYLLDPFITSVDTAMQER